jgi:hypothetical protein
MQWLQFGQYLAPDMWNQTGSHLPGEEEFFPL